MVGIFEGMIIFKLRKLKCFIRQVSEMTFVGNPLEVMNISTKKLLAQIKELIG